jgi:hypothetical protein
MLMHTAMERFGRVGFILTASGTLLLITWMICFEHLLTLEILLAATFIRKTPQQGETMALSSNEIGVAAVAVPLVVAAAMYKDMGRNPPRGKIPASGNPKKAPKR